MSDREIAQKDAKIAEWIAYADKLEACNHDWTEEDFRRHCTKCGAHQMMYENKYPEVGEAKYEWR